MKKQQGFTLVELLVVMAIIGLLIGLALAGLNVARMNQRDTARRSAVNDLRTQVEAFAGNNGGSYPNGAGAGKDITASGTKITVGTQPAIDEANGTTFSSVAVAGTGCGGVKEATSSKLDICYAPNANKTGYEIEAELEGSTANFTVTGGDYGAATSF